MIFDLRGNQISLDSPVVFTAGQGSLRIGRVSCISSNQLKPGFIMVKTSVNRYDRLGGQRIPSFKEIKLKLSGHWVHDKDGTPLCDRVMLLEQ